MSNKSTIILSASIRNGRQSHKVAQVLYKIATQNQENNLIFIDLKDYALPFLTDKHSDIIPPIDALEELISLLQKAAGLIIVTPEYKAGIPGHLKNMLDLLPAQILHHKIAGIVTTSSGGFGGINCLTQLRPILLSTGALCIPEKLCISHVGLFPDSINLTEMEPIHQKICTFWDSFKWYIDHIND